MNIKKELGEKIKTIRKKRNLTQEQLAEKIDISSRNLSNIELGVNFPKAETLEKILKVLDITTEDLFANEHIKTTEELILQINTYISFIKNDYKTLQLVYKLLRDIIEN